jgi:hypothetical protein
MQTLYRPLYICMLSLQVITLAGELLSKAGGLLQEGLTTTEVADGYEIAGAKVCVMRALGST